MATTLTINYSVNGVEKNLILTEITRCSEDFKSEYVSLNISCNDIVENSILGELMNSIISDIIFIEDSETTTFTNYTRLYNINRSYKGEGSSLTFNLREYFN